MYLDLFTINIWAIRLPFLSKEFLLLQAVNKICLRPVLVQTLEFYLLQCLQSTYTILNIEFWGKSFGEDIHIVVISWGKGGDFQCFESFELLGLFYSVK